MSLKAQRDLWVSSFTLLSCGEDYATGTLRWIIFWHHRALGNVCCDVVWVLTVYLWSAFFISTGSSCLQISGGLLLPSSELGKGSSAQSSKLSFGEECSCKKTIAKETANVLAQHFFLCVFPASLWTTPFVFLLSLLTSIHPAPHHSGVKEVCLKCLFLKHKAWQDHRGCSESLSEEGQFECERNQESGSSLLPCPLFWFMVQNKSILVLKHGNSQGEASLSKSEVRNHVWKEIWKLRQVLRFKVKLWELKTLSTLRLYLGLNYSSCSITQWRLLSGEGRKSQKLELLQV